MGQGRLIANRASARLYPGPCREHPAPFRRATSGCRIVRATTAETREYATFLLRRAGIGSGEPGSAAILGVARLRASARTRRFLAGLTIAQRSRQRTSPPQCCSSANLFAIARYCLFRTKPQSRRCLVTNRSLRGRIRPVRGGAIAKVESSHRARHARHAIRNVFIKNTRPRVCDGHWRDEGVTSV